MIPGKYDDISLEDYHAMGEWSKSMLDHIDKSPAHFLEWRSNPPEPTPSMEFGSALHCAVLTPSLYESQYAIAPECDRRTKDGKIIYADFLEKSVGKKAIASLNAEKISSMALAILNHPIASILLTMGEAEQSFFWVDPKTGLECKARPDYLRYDNICIDLKVTHDLTQRGFMNTAHKFRYHVQAAFFIDGIFQSTGRQCDDFVFIAIEDEPPYGIKAFLADNFFIEHGRNVYRKNLLTVRDWLDHPDKYSTVYPESINPIELSLPHWVSTEELSYGNRQIDNENSYQPVSVLSDDE